MLNKYIIINKYIVVTFVLSLTMTVAYTNLAYADEVKLPTEYTLKLNSDEINLISEGLQTQPYGKVFPLINKLRQQILEQQQAVKQPLAKPSPKPEIKDK